MWGKEEVFVFQQFLLQVCQSHSLPLSASSSESSSRDFSLHFASIFPLQIVQWPESLKLQLLEGGHLRPTLLAEIFLPLPESHVTLDSLSASASASASVPAVAAPGEDESGRPAAAARFSSDHQVRHAGHAGVGAGVDFASTVDGSQIRSEWTRGRVFARVGWGRTSDGVVLSPPAAQWRPPTHQAKEG